jgi:CBS domain-containing protein
MKVGDIMTRDVKYCHPGDNLATVAMIMWENDCGAVPVAADDGRVVGMITDRDVCMAVGTRGRAASDITVGEVISLRVYSCRADTDLELAVAIMKRKQVRRLPVTDDWGILSGILSINDVINHSKKGGGDKLVSHGEVMAALKAISEQRTEPVEELSNPTGLDMPS